jgi:hypothetical protein
VVRDRPGYRDIADALRQRISSGALEPGYRLTGEAALAAEFGVARCTARFSHAGHRGGWPSACRARPRAVRGRYDDERRGSASYEGVAALLRTLIKRDHLGPVRHCRARVSCASR